MNTEILKKLTELQAQLDEEGKKENPDRKLMQQLSEKIIVLGMQLSQVDIFGYQYNNRK